jgi:hypothetical protein
VSDEITVLFAEDSEGYTSLLEHVDAAKAPEVVAWDDHEPRVKSGRALVNLLNEVDAHPEQKLPDVILIDDWMSWDGTEPVRPNAVRLVGMVTRMLGARRPKLVLWTSVQEEPWLRRFAFLSYGGHHVAHKNEPGDPDAHALEIIRAVMAEKLHPLATDLEPREPLPWPKLGRLEDRAQIAGNLDYIAALDATKHSEGAASLLGTTTYAVEAAKKRVGRALGREHGEKWSQERFCQEAREAGWLWVPPSEWRHNPYAAWRRAGAMKRRRTTGADGEPED